LDLEVSKRQGNREYFLEITAFAKDGSIGIDAIVESVILKPDENNPQRIRI
jgi:hypothetical protein